jgi:hypothetical protein
MGTYFLLYRHQFSCLCLHLSHWNTESSRFPYHWRLFFPFYPFPLQFLNLQGILWYLIQLWEVAC